LRVTDIFGNKWIFKRDVRPIMRRISLLHAPLFIMFVSLLAIAKWMTPPLSWPKQAFDFDNDRGW
jgi:hypothetical protein